LLLSTLRIEPLVLAFEVVAPVLLEVVVIPIGITAKVGGAETGLPGAMFVWPPGLECPGATAAARGSPWCAPVRGPGYEVVPYETDDWRGTGS